MPSNGNESPLVDVVAPLTLNDIFGVIPGIFLLLGFTLAWTFARLEPSITYNVEDQKPIYDEKVIQIPDPHFIDDKPSVARPYLFLIPRLGPDGRALLQPIRRSVRGRGKPILNEIHAIILKPVIGEPEILREERLEPPPPNGPYDSVPPELVFKFTRVYYSPNVSLKSTDTYDTTQEVHFESSIDRDGWALFGALIGSVLSGAYVSLKLVASHFARKRRRVRTINDAVGEAAPSKRQSEESKL